MKSLSSFLMVTTVAVVGLAGGSVLAQPMTITPAPPGQPVQPVPPMTITPATPGQPVQPVPPAQPAPIAEPVRPTEPARPGEVDPRISYRAGDILMRLMLGGMPGEGMAAMDTDGDGKISAAEFQAAADAFFTQLDTNGDGLLDDADRREPAVAEGGDARPSVDRGEVERRMQEFRGGMMGPNGGMMFGPMFFGMPGMWFFAVPVMPGGPGFGGGGRMWEERPGPGAGPGGGWYYWGEPERRRD
jgi:hypothetical protein